MNDRTDITTTRVTDAAERARDALATHERHLYGTDAHARACGTLAARVGALLAALDEQDALRALDAEAEREREDAAADWAQGIDTGDER